MAAFASRDVQGSCEGNDTDEETARDNTTASAATNSDTRIYKKKNSHATSGCNDGLCENDNLSFSEEDAFIALDDNNEDDLPIDKGWAWVVLAGLALGYIRGLAILFLEYLRIFKASTAKTTLLMGVNAAVYSISALLSMHILVGTAGVRKTLFIGSGITVIAMALAIFPTSIDFLIGMHSVLLGVGNSMIFGPSVVAVRHYFKQKYGFASAVAMAGDSLGGSIFPLLIRYLLDEYGLQGTMIILTGLSMNMFVGAAACIPLQSFCKKKKRNMSPMATPVNRGNHELNEEATESKIRMIQNVNHNSSPGPVINHFRRKKEDDQMMTETSVNLLALSKTNIVLSGSRVDLGSVVSVLDPLTDGSTDIGSGKKTSRVGIRKLLSTLDFTLFKYPMFVLVVSYSFFNITVAILGDYLPALASEKGISQQDAAFFLTILGVMDFVGRLSVGVVIDRGHIRVNNLMATGLIIAGTAAQFTHYFNSYVILLVFAVITGLSTSMYFGLCPTAIVEFVGVEYMAKTVGFASLFHGMSVAIANPIVGSIRDGTGSYTWGYNYIGVCCFIGGILLLCEPFVRRYSTRNNKKLIHADRK